MDSFTQLIRGTGSVAEVIAIYDEHCTTYEKMVCEKGKYKGPFILVEAVTKEVPECRRKEVRVLDVAAGTGMVGVALAQKGFTNLDALEPSEGMLECLRSKNVYTNTFHEYIGQGHTNVPQGCYDLVFAVGGMGYNHIPFTGVLEFVRFAKPGGLVMICMRHDEEDYLTKLKEYMNRLEEQQLWKKEFSTPIKDFLIGTEGILFVYQVL
ncbi:hypothetical protein Pcinc_028522 [Petrolisthes cinctipes]|uniref:Methyltransferase domain-containing protein n=1 Tax=Petrolisthes cinctipes TaxID=88211 RepID=A0AAE1F2W6_PETCI|nr:hypothetical protein Pcinc_028522 [Petrolisthes cinctipes]